MRRSRRAVRDKKMKMTNGVIVGAALSAIGMYAATAFAGQGAQVHVESVGMTSSGMVYAYFSEDVCTDASSVQIRNSGAMQPGTTVDGDTISDVVADRFLKIATAAKLSGKRVAVWYDKDTNVDRRCAIRTIKLID